MRSLGLVVLPHLGHVPLLIPIPKDLDRSADKLPGSLLAQRRRPVLPQHQLGLDNSDTPGSPHTQFHLELNLGLGGTGRCRPCGWKRPRQHLHLQSRSACLARGAPRRDVPPIAKLVPPWVLLNHHPAGGGGARPQFGVDAGTYQLHQPIGVGLGLQAGHRRPVALHTAVHTAAHAAAHTGGLGGWGLGAARGWGRGL
eukprot:scaffold5352_cov112-Isochrysis_galbana.AAC.1